MLSFRLDCYASRRAVLACVSAAWALCAAGPVSGQSLEVRVSPLGSAAKERPLPVGATPRISVEVRNGGGRASGAIVLTVRGEGVSAAAGPDWRSESGALVAEMPGLAPGARAERTIRLKVDRAPVSATKAQVRVEARGSAGANGTGEAELTVADCVGAYREKLAALRGDLLNPVRDAAETLRRPDATLPIGRQYPATGVRKGELLDAERFAAAFAAFGGGDPQMATEWFRFLVQRFASEINAYASQAANPGMCASNYYQIAGYRQGLTPITNRIDAVRAASRNAIGAARTALKADPDDELAVLIRRAVGDAGESVVASALTPLAALAAVRAIAAQGRSKDELQALSLSETAAWLAETDRRGQALKQAIDRALQRIADAHRETCVCAF
jgi:hypothetical protein